MYSTFCVIGRGRSAGVRAALLAVLIVGFLAVTAAGAQAASFTITNKSDPALGSAPATYHVEFKAFFKDATLPAGYQPPGDFSLAPGEVRTFDVHRGYYTVSQLTPDGWALTNIECIATRLPGNAGGPRPDPAPEDAFVINMQNASARIELSVHENKGCDFTSTLKPAAAPPVVTPTVAPAPAAGSAPVALTPPPKSGVLGQQVQSAAARLSAPTRCVSNRYSVSVVGGPVSSVAFAINGKQVRTMKARKNQRRFTAHLPAGASVQRIVALVSFASNAQPRTKTLRATVRRCSQGAVKPQFTG